MRLTVLVLLALAIVLPAQASAVTTVSVRESCSSVDEYRGPVTQCAASATATGDDGPSEVTAAIDGPEAIVVSDTAGVAAGPGCEAVPGSSGTAVRCASELGRPSLSTDGRGGDDRLLLTGFGQATGGAGDDVIEGTGPLDGGPGDDVLRGHAGDTRLDGGPGADVLQGGEGEDRLDGGPGADALDGGPDGDFMEFRSRSTAVIVDLGTGTSGEGDRLTGVEGVLGGSGDDDLRGGGGDDVLFGGPGDDELRGADGDDALIDGDGRDILDGGAGDDDLTTGRPLGLVPPDVVDLGAAGDPDSRSIVLGGAGEDYLSSGLGSDRLDPGAGSDSASAHGGRDTVWTREGHHDVVRCGRYAAVRVGSRDLTQRCRRVERTGTPRPRIMGAEAGLDRGFLELGCSDDHPDECRALLRVYALGREVDRERFNVRPGRTDGPSISFGSRVREEIEERGEVGVVYRVDTRDGRGRPVVLRARRTLCPGDC